jgi:hypothetical protein
MLNKKNVRVALTSSPAEFDFQVENPLPSLAKIDLVINKSRYQNWRGTIKKDIGIITIREGIFVIIVNADCCPG